MVERACQHPARSRIGVFGGTFDPIHIGHLIVAEEARIQLRLCEVVFMVAGQPWLKAGQRITDPRHRMAMVEFAVEMCMEQARAG